MKPKTPPKVKTSFTNTKGEKVTVYTDGTKNRVAAPSPVVNNNVDLSKVVTDKKPTGTTTPSLRDLSIAFSPNATDAQMQEIATRNPDLASKASEQKTLAANNPSQFVSTNFSNLDPKSQLKSEAGLIGDQIAQLEKSIADKSSNRDVALDEAGVYDDLKTLNDLKAKQRLAEDREIEIGIEGRQALRGNQATKTEFDASTRPARENNLLDQLAASRETSRLTDAINTNIQVIDSKLDAQFEKDKFMLEQKVARLTKVEQAHKDIITAEQAEALADRQFQEQVLLKGLEFENDIKKDIIKDLAVSGLTGPELTKALSGSLTDLIQARSNAMNTTNWSNLTRQQGIQMFTGDQLDRFLAYDDVRDSISAEDQAILDQNGALAMDSDSLIGTIEQMLDNPDGLSEVTGGGLFGLGRANFWEDPASQKFLNDGKNLIASLSLDSLQQAIANGATFGALSDAELQLVANASNNLGAILKEGNVTGFASGEQELMDNLEILQLASMKNYLKATGHAPQNLDMMSAYSADGQKNTEVYETIKDMYKAAKANPKALPTNPAQSEIGADGKLNATFELIKEEEGLRTEAYQDQTGKWTIGFGTTTINGRPVKPGDKLSTTQAEAIMQQQVMNNYTTFADKVNIDLRPSQFAALTSFEYNLGPGVWNDATGQQIISFINAGKLTEAGQLMQLYNKARNPSSGNLAYHPVLAGRRAREAQLLTANA